MHCLCALLPTLTSRTKFVVVRHFQEQFKTSNTGRLLARYLPETVMQDWRGRGDPWAPLNLPADAVMLFPGDEAHPALSPEDLGAMSGRTVVLVDGTWKQSRKMTRMVPDLNGIQRVALSAPTAPEMVLRRRVVPNGLCTIEAAAHMLTALGEPEVGEDLLTVWRLLVRQILMSKGLAPDKRVAQLAASSRAQWRSVDETDPNT